MRNKVKHIFIAIGIFILLIITIGILNPTHDPKPTKTNTSQENNVANVTKIEAENACQDANLLKQYIDLDKISIVTTSYNPYFGDDGSGNALLQWSGENKDTGSKVLFVCTVAKENGKAVVKSLAIDGKQVL